MHSTSENQCLKQAISFVGVSAEWEQKLHVIGLGCDGTNVNIADGGLKGFIQKDLPWVEVVWSLAHRLKIVTQRYT